MNKLFFVTTFLTFIIHQTYLLVFASKSAQINFYKEIHSLYKTETI